MTNTTETTTQAGDLFVGNLVDMEPAIEWLDQNGYGAGISQIDRMVCQDSLATVEAVELLGGGIALISTDLVVLDLPENLEIITVTEKV